MNATNPPRTITQSELRNECAAILDAVQAGESMIITRRGVPIAEFVPIRRRREISTEELRRAFSAGADPDYAAMRAEIDTYFGEERIGDDQ